MTTPVRALRAVRVLIADDQMTARQGFTVLLNAEEGIEVVGQAVDGLDAVDKVAELAQAVRVMAAGDTLLAPNITKRLIAEFSRMTGAPRAPLKDRVGDLTERETEVLSLIAQGLSNAEIAERLVVAEQTVKTRVSRILVKLGLRDRTQAAVFAYETGLVRPVGY